MEYIYSDAVNVNFRRTICSLLKKILFVFNFYFAMRYSHLLSCSENNLQLIKEDPFCFQLLFCNEIQSFTELFGEQSAAY